MATSKSRSFNQARKLKTQRAKLKGLGLLPSRVDLRKKVTAADKRAIRKFGDVLKGRASVVTMPDKKAAAKYKDKFFVRGSKVVIARQKGERFKVQGGRIIGVRKEYGRKITKTIAPTGETVPPQIGPKQPSTLHYAIPFQRQDELEWFTFTQYQDLENFMARDSIRNYKDWQKHVVFLSVEDLAEIKEGGETVHRIRSRRKSKKRRGKRRVM